MKAINIINAICLCLLWSSSAVSQTSAWDILSSKPHEPIVQNDEKASGVGLIESVELRSEANFTQGTPDLILRVKPKNFWQIEDEERALSLEQKIAGRIAYDARARMIYNRAVILAKMVGLDGRLALTML